MKVDLDVEGRGQMSQKCNHFITHICSR